MSNVRLLTEQRLEIILKGRTIYLYLLSTECLNIKVCKAVRGEKRHNVAIYITSRTGNLLDNIC